MASNGFLPQEKLTIYTNTFKEDIFSGNIMIEIADHLLQFISINKNEVKHIKPNYYKRDYQMFNEHEFLADISSNDWENNITDTMQNIISLSGISRRKLIDENKK